MLLPRSGRVIGIVAGLALVLSSAPAWASSGGKLEGKCTGENGEPLVGYLVQIQRPDNNAIYKTKTNKKGEYMHIGLPVGEYKVTLQTPEGKNVFILNVNVKVGRGDWTTLDFDMAKERKLAVEARNKRIEEDPELKRRMEEQAKAAKQLTGLKELFEQGSAFMEQKQYAEAVPMFEQALTLAKAKNIPIVMGRLADAYRRSKMNDKAIETYQKLIALVPTDANYHNNLANVYVAMGKNEEAAAEFQKAADLDPARAATYHYNFGAVMYNMGNMDEAIGAFQKAIATDPAFAEAQFLLGRSLMGKLDMDPTTGKIVAAPGTVEALEAYLKLEPQGRHAAEAQSMLQTMESSVETTFKKKKKKKSKS